MTEEEAAVQTAPESTDQAEEPQIPEELKARQEAEKERNEARKTRSALIMAQFGIEAEQLTDWKRKFGKVSSVHIGRQLYIYRALFRDEYAAIMSVELPADLQNNPIKARQFNEEMIAKKCLLFPELMGSGIRKGHAGTLNTLSELILNLSGFTPDDVPVEL